MTETSSNNPTPAGESAADFVPDDRNRATAQSLLEALSGDTQFAPEDFPDRPRSRFARGGETQAPIPSEVPPAIWFKPENIDDFNELSHSLLDWLIEQYNADGAMLIDDSGSIVCRRGGFRHNPELLATVPLLLRRSCFRSHKLLGVVAKNGVKTVGINLDGRNMLHVAYVPLPDKPLWLLAGGSSETLGQPVIAKAAEYLLAL